MKQKCKIYFDNARLKCLQPKYNPKSFDKYKKFSQTMCVTFIQIRTRKINLNSYFHSIKKTEKISVIVMTFQNKRPNTSLQFIQNINNYSTTFLAQIPIRNKNMQFFERIDISKMRRHFYKILN